MKNSGIEKIRNKKVTAPFLLIDDNIEWMHDFMQLFAENLEQVVSDASVDLKIISILNCGSMQMKWGRYTHELKKAKTKEERQKIPKPNMAECLLNDIKEGREYIKECQGILLDWELNLEPEKQELVERIKSLRRELPIYIITNNPNGLDVINDSYGHIEGFFYKPDIQSDIIDIIRRLLSSFNHRRTSPFWTAYKEYVNRAVDTWHTPGHSGGTSFRISDYISDFFDFFQFGTFKGDLSISVDELGSLLDSTKYVGTAQKRAATVFGAKHTFFVTNGSSTANKIIIQTILRSGDEVIVDRNCHKSVHYGVIQSGANPHFLNSMYDAELGIFAPPSYEHIKEIVEANPNTKLLILTGCTYDGILTDLKPIVQLCHEFGIKVMIDEAWFAYSRFHPDFNQFSAVESGADYVTHSSHKTLSAFSQASMIHVNDPDFDEDYFREIFYIYTSTSPHYQIIASLDVAATQMLMEGYKMLSNTLQLATEFRNMIKSELKHFKLVDEEEFQAKFNHLKTDESGFDKLKVLIDFSATGIKGTELIQEIRDKAGLEIEKSTHSTFLVLFTIGTKPRKVNSLYMTLKQIDERKPGNHSPKAIDIPDEIELCENPNKVFTGPRKAIEYLKAKNEISAGLVTPYPPGIPFLMPGQKITQDHIDYIRDVLKPNNVEVHGLFDDEIYVKDDAKEN